MKDTFKQASPLTTRKTFFGITHALKKFHHPVKNPDDNELCDSTIHQLINALQTYRTKSNT